MVEWVQKYDWGINHVISHYATLGEIAKYKRLKNNKGGYKL